MKKRTHAVLSIFMLFPKLEERIHTSRRNLHNATSDNIIELCQQYLELLAEFRTELYKLNVSPRINQGSGSFLQEDVGYARKEIRAAIENSTRERNETEALLFSFTSVSAYEAVKTFNKHKYKGFDDWELKAGGVVRFSDDSAGSRITVQEAVNIASLLRREEYVADSAKQSRA